MTAPVNPQATDRQLVYARWLDVGTKIGFLALVAAFAAYVFEVAPSHVPLDQLPRFWNLPVDEYLAAARVEAGWGWVEHILKGDYMNLAGVAILSSVSILCYFRLVPIVWRERDRAYASIVMLELAVLLLAASGLLDGSH